MHFMKTSGVTTKHSTPQMYLRPGRGSRFFLSVECCESTRIIFNNFRDTRGKPTDDGRCLSQNPNMLSDWSKSITTCSFTPFKWSEMGKKINFSIAEWNIKNVWQ